MGKIGSDGVVGLTRGFFYAGTPSVMATVWDVADEPTSRLITDFYRSYFRTKDKSRSLREAQIRLIRSLRAGQMKVDSPFGQITLPEHPLFWAGFLLFGEP
jgi:CHAT domain-containing protein